MLLIKRKPLSQCRWRKTVCVGWRAIEPIEQIMKIVYKLWFTFMVSSIFHILYLSIEPCGAVSAERSTEEQSYKGKIYLTFNYSRCRFRSTVCVASCHALCLLPSFLIGCKLFVCFLLIWCAVLCSSSSSLAT